MIYVINSMYFNVEKEEDNYVYRISSVKYDHYKEMVLDGNNEQPKALELWVWSDVLKGRLRFYRSSDAYAGPFDTFRATTQMVEKYPFLKNVRIEVVYQ